MFYSSSPPQKYIIRDQLVCGGLNINGDITRIHDIYHRYLKTGLCTWFSIIVYNIPPYPPIFYQINFDNKGSTNTPSWNIIYHNYISIVKGGHSNRCSHMTTFIIFSTMDEPIKVEESYWGIWANYLPRIWPLKSYTTILKRCSDSILLY